MPEHRLVLFLVPMLACAFASWSHAAGELEVTALNPPPNYAATRDDEDAAQLVDGQYSRFPAWIHRGSVGWVNQTPVSVTLSAATREGATYSLVLHTARQSRAGVAPPRRVDVYCGTRFSSAWRHAGALIHALDGSADGGPVVLTVPVAGCGGTRLQVVIHAEGTFVMLDELTLEPLLDTPRYPATTESSDSTRLATPSARIDAPATDSTRRLETGLRMRAEAALANAVAALPGTGSHAGLASPWLALDRPVTATRLSVHALPDAPVHYVIGLANDNPTPRHFRIIPEVGSEVGGTPAVAAKLQRLEPLLAADGRIAFDLPVPVAEPLHLPPRGLSFILATEPAGAASGPRYWRVSDDTGWTHQLTVDLTVHDSIRPAPEDRPAVLVWTYTRDTPIWSDANAATTFDRLTADGVNVFEIHPRDIPQPFAEGAWEERTVALRRALELHRGRGLVLLFLGTEGWQALSSMKNDAPTRNALTRWVRVLATTAREAGYAKDDWALYPLDEPHGTDLARLATVIDALRGIDPSLRFYANPTAGRGLESSTVSRLRVMAGHVDYWQPRAGAVLDSVRQMLGEQTSAPARAPALWLYANPPAPARSAVPACYRDLGRLAYDNGATGLGFWSLSDTAKSSAWSDFDGQRPDWSVVYESRGNIIEPFIAGRRWLAFVAGVTDHSALRFCARRGAGDPTGNGVVAVQCRTFRNALDAARPKCVDWW